MNVDIKKNVNCVNLTALITISISILSLSLHFFLFSEERIDVILDILMDIIMNEAFDFEAIDILMPIEIEEGTEGN